MRQEPPMSDGPAFRLFLPSSLFLSPFPFLYPLLCLLPLFLLPFRQKALQHTPSHHQEDPHGIGIAQEAAHPSGATLPQSVVEELADTGGCHRACPQDAQLF